jgi:antitoxin MazE
MKAVVQKWGNSLAVRIPKAVAEGASVHQGSSIDISVDATGKMVLKPVKKRYSLKELVDKITPRNLHPEADFGKPMGGEVW